MAGWRRTCSSKQHAADWQEQRQKHSVRYPRARSGLTWAKLRDPGNDMLLLWLIFAAESVWIAFAAWYVEQVGVVAAASCAAWLGN
jgi:hypothetical protein